MPLTAHDLTAHALTAHDLTAAPGGGDFLDRQPEDARVRDAATGVLDIPLAVPRSAPGSATGGTADLRGGSRQPEASQNSWKTQIRRCYPSSTHILTCISKSRR